jgi:hypothetical protein
MIDVLHLAWRYLRYHWIKTVILVVSISLILFVPSGLYVVVQQGTETLTARAAATPLLIGSKGSAVDLALSALYFQEPSVDPVPFRELDSVNQSGLAEGIPLHVRFVAGRNRIVGTNLEYFAFRSLRLVDGRLMATLGECVVGARAAKELGVGVGDDVLSTPAGAFDVAGSFPLKMKVVGVLASSGTPDDHVVFADVKTTWVIEGLAHGHQDLRESDIPHALVLSYSEITPDNIDSFHFHGDPAEFPVNAVISSSAQVGSPRDRQDAGLLADRLSWLPDSERKTLLKSVAVVRLPSGQDADVIEAVGEGVIFNHLGHIMDTHINRLLVLRPQVSSQQRTQALANVFLFLGDEYDFKFDFADASKQVCTEVVYRALDGNGPIQFSLVKRAGHETLSADDIANNYLTAPGKSFDFVLFAEEAPDSKEHRARILTEDVGKSRLRELMAGGGKS